jgi:hypothetical protein
VETPVLNHWNYNNYPNWFNTVMDRWGWDYYPNPCTLHAPLSNGVQSFAPGNHGLGPEFTIYVPGDRLEAYQTALGWKTYYNGPMALLNYSAVFQTGSNAEPVIQNRYKPLSALPEEYRQALQDSGRNY